MENQIHAGAALLQPRLAPDTRIETTALPAQLGNGPATDCWIVRDDGGDNVLIGYGHDDRATVPRSSIRLPNAAMDLPGGPGGPKTNSDVAAG